VSGSAIVGIRAVARRVALPPSVLALALALAACQPSGSDSGLRGRVEIDGSSTVFPITEAMAEEFQLANRGVQVTVGVSGTGGGFERFCSGETDVSDASRPIKAAEEAQELCADAGIEFLELPVAFDGLTVAVNPDNDWVDVLTVEEVRHIFRPEDPATNWRDVRDGFPDEEIVVFAPGADSGTFDYFTETINGESEAHRSENTTFSEDDNVLVIGVSGERGGIGYFGYSYYVNNANRLRAAAIVNPATGEAVLPSLETINTGTYAPLSRPLFIYVAADALTRPEVAAFVEFYLTEGRPLIDAPEVGYVQLPDALYERNLERIREGDYGSPFNAAPAGPALLERYGA
jgi:phosphate transport system substrate-binding protein